MTDLELVATLLLGLALTLSAVIGLGVLAAIETILENGREQR